MRLEELEEELEVVESVDGDLDRERWRRREPWWREEVGVAPSREGAERW